LEHWRWEAKHKATHKLEMNLITGTCDLETWKNIRTKPTFRRIEKINMKIALHAEHAQQTK